MYKSLIATMLLSLFSGSANAHSGHLSQGFLSGFMHPFSGLDHVLVMLAIGLWAGKTGGHTRWQLPLTFVTVMALSALAGASSSPSLEIWIAASVLAVGLILSLSVPIRRSIKLILTAMFAMAHGFAHGAELSFAQDLQICIGIISATVLLHGIGVLIAMHKTKMLLSMQVALGWIIFLAGGLMLIVTT